jgi:hypothetical protein
MEWLKEEKYLKILKAMLDTETMTFQQIANIVGNRKIAQTRINYILNKKAIEDLTPGSNLNSPKHPGRAARYVLTNSGRSIAQDAVLHDYEAALKVLQELTARLAQKPETLPIFRKQLQQKHEKQREKERLALVDESLKPHPTSEKITVLDPAGNHSRIEGYVVEEIECFKKTITEEDMIVKSLRTLFNIYEQVHLKPSQRSPCVVGFPEKGGLHLIPVSILKKHGLGTSL